jgi:hypothetical protein
LDEAIYWLSVQARLVGENGQSGIAAYYPYEAT